jgi:hypothetical protein
LDEYTKLHRELVDLSEKEEIIATPQINVLGFFEGIGKLASFRTFGH